MLPILDRFLFARFSVAYGVLLCALLCGRFAIARGFASFDGLFFGLAIATLTLGVAVFGAMVRTSEILALRASGISLVRIARIPILLAATSSAVLLVCATSDPIGWWRMVAGSTSVPLMMAVSLPLAALNARRDDSWLIALLGVFAYTCALVVAVAFQGIGLLDSIRAPWIGPGALALTAGLLYRKSAFVR